MRVPKFVTMACVAATVSACTGAEAQRAQTRTRYVVGADASKSVTPEQAATWCTDVDRAVLSNLTFGDALVVLPLSDHTAEAAPRAWTISEVSEDDGLEATGKARRELAAAVREGREAVCSILQSQTRALSTRIVAVFNRIRRDPSRETRVVLLTDGLESQDGLDLERTRLNSSNITALATAALNRERPEMDALRGVQVQFVLDSPPIGKQLLNSRRDLEAFWRPIVETLGGTLTQFDSAITK